MGVSILQKVVPSHVCKVTKPFVGRHVQYHRRIRRTVLVVRSNPQGIPVPTHVKTFGINYNIHLDGGL